MNVEMLSHFLEVPEVQERLLAGYSGKYSLGIGNSPGPTGEPVLVLHVQEGSAIDFPDHLNLDGEVVRVLVQQNFIAPVAYRSVEHSGTPKIDLQSKK